ncbi:MULTISPECIES: Phenylacetic acid catabolic protein [Alicyclobacillus]|uniref:Phenylacetic acid catabolic protein n=1 Tax=Alicyclobacillus vulcanalis TaxID=252246 RepID=A0A1N7LL85_9BACL|nr:MULTISPECIES: Phenylacetic acid catabolic protein [Alicyclobacillus]SIS74562.1 Phenylacetic acid catabolic protein [Alicyclobacillus vulcanalis]
MDPAKWAPILLSLADSKFHLGDRLVEVGVSAPELQSALVCVAFAQAELGHARLLYNWVSEWHGETSDVSGPGGSGVQQLTEIQEWIPLMVATHLINVAALEVLSWIREEGDATSLQKISKMENELREHIVFSRAWCNRFAEDTGAVPRVFADEHSRWEEVVSRWLVGLANQVDPNQAVERVNRARSVWHIPLASGRVTALVHQTTMQP